MSYVNRKRKKVTSAISDAVKKVYDAHVSVFEFVRDEAIVPAFEPIFKLFGVEDETVYFTSLSTTEIPIQETAYLSNLIINSVREDLDIAAEIKYGLLTGPRATAEKYLNYANNNYSSGLLQTVLSEKFTDTINVEPIISAEVGEGVTLTSTELSQPEISLWCQKFLQDNFNYSIETNTFQYLGSNWFFDFGELNGTATAYTISMYRPITTTTVTEQYVVISNDGVDETRTEFIRTTETITNTTSAETVVNISDSVPVITTSPDIGNPDSTVITPIDEVVNSVEENTVLPIEVTLPNSGNYYGVVYYLNTNPSTKLIWFYELASDIYPELSLAGEGYTTDNLETLPIITLCKQFVYANADTSSQEYKDASRLMGILGVTTLDGIIDSIKENGDSQFIQDAFLNFGVNLYSENQADRVYLFNFFSLLEKVSTVSKADFDALSAADKSTSNQTYAVKQGRFNLTFTYQYVEETIHTGNIGEKVGFVKTEFIVLEDTPSDYIEEDEEEAPQFGQGEDGRSEPRPPSQSEDDSDKSKGLINSKVILTAQVTENEYIELEVRGVMLTTGIVTEGTRVDLHPVSLTSNTALKKNFNIPVSLAVIDVMQPMEIETVLYNSLKLTIYAEQSQYLEYYETEAFYKFINVVITVIAIAILVFSLGTATNLSAALISLGRALLTQYLLTLALKEILTHNLSEAERAAVLALYAAASAYNAANAGGVDLSAITFAETLMYLIPAVGNALQIDIEDKSKDLTSETEAFEQIRTDKIEELDQAKDFLNNDSQLDLFQLLNSRNVPKFNVDETPTDFIDRSLIVNVAPIVNSRTGTYVSSTLNLDNIDSIFNINDPANSLTDGLV